MENSKENVGNKEFFADFGISVLFTKNKLKVIKVKYRELYGCKL